ncbi:MAG: hypothetical protein KF850_39625 [Labilithrix sp.]|nr:hypothetical protein [Labilithrix sp.]
MRPLGIGCGGIRIDTTKRHRRADRVGIPDRRIARESNELTNPDVNPDAQSTPEELHELVAHALTRAPIRCVDRIERGADIARINTALPRVVGREPPHPEEEEEVNHHDRGAELEDDERDPAMRFKLAKRDEDSDRGEHVEECPPRP